ncbi:hypothetical protein Tco_1473028 [Tanacetum coccineum]
MKLTTGRLVNGSSCNGIDMDIIAEFCSPSRWKELSKESGSKILPCGDGSYWKASKPVASLIMQIAQPCMNLAQDRQMQMIGGNDGNQFRQYVGQNVGNQNGYNAVQIVRNQVVQNAVQNLGIQNVRNHNGLIVILGIANQNLNPNGNGNVVAARAEGNAIRNDGNQIRCYNYRGLGHLASNCTVRPRKRDAAFLQTQLLIAQKEEAGI